MAICHYGIKANEFHVGVVYRVVEERFLFRGRHQVPLAYSPLVKAVNELLFETAVIVITPSMVFVVAGHCGTLRECKSLITEHSLSQSEVAVSVGNI